MRIIVLQDYLRSGGTERQAVSLCREFQDAGAEATLITFRPGGRLASMADELAIDHRPLTQLNLGVDFLAPGLTKTLRRQRPDVVLCMGENANDRGGLLQARLPNSTVVGTLRLGKPRLSRPNLRSFRRLRAIVTNTRWWKSQLVELGVDAERVFVVPNGLGRRWDFTRRDSERARIRKALGVSAAEVVLLNVAGFRSGKRQEELIRLAARLPDGLHWRLWLVGDGPRLAACRQLVDSMGLQARVHFTGHVGDPFPYYAGADIAVSVSARDALPNFLVEAQSLQLPAVASDYRGVAEALEDGATGHLVPMDSDDAFLERLSALISQGARRERMGRAARARALALHEPRLQAAKYLDIFRALHSV